MKKKNLKHSNRLALPQIKQFTSPSENPFNFARIKYLQLSNAYLLDDDKLPINNFKQRITSIMSEYKYDSMEEDEKKTDIANLLQSSVRSTYKKDKEDIKKFISRTNRLMKSESSPLVFNNLFAKDPSTNKQNQINEADIQFTIQRENFKSPLQSYNIVQKNKIIYENLMENYGNREFDKFKNTYSRISNFMNQTKQTPKIKIIPKIPKTVDLHLSKKKDKNGSSKHKSNSLTLSDKKVTSIQLICRYFYSQKVFPESRDQFIFCQEGNEIILHGGLVINKSPTIWRLNPLTFNWTKLIPAHSFSAPRYGHSGVIYHRKLIIFGGRYYDIPIYGDVDVFNLDTLTWNTPTLYTSTKQIKFRRNHIACAVGNQMLVHGGVDNEGVYLNDSFLLNLNPLKWVACHITSLKNFPTLAFHSCCLVLQEEYRLNSKMTIYRYPEIGKQPLVQQIREKGIYVFGGKEAESGPISNTLWVLRIGKTPLEWVKLKTQGEGPSARFSTSINYYEEGNCVIVHGGRNDYSGANFALNDTYILELYKLEWIKVTYYSENQSAITNNRCSHSTLVYGHNLIVFGGMNSENYVGSSLFLIELDSKNKIQSKIEESIFDKMINKIAKKK